MEAALPPPACDGDGGDVVADGVIHSRTVNGVEHCAIDAPLPPIQCNNGDVADADKPSCDRTKRARVFLAIGLLFELAATLWAFQQAVSAGALYGDVYCDAENRLAKLYGSRLVVSRCGNQIDADVFFNVTTTLDGYYSAASEWGEYVGCNSLTATAADKEAFEEHCDCYTTSSGGYLYYTNTYGLLTESCSWVALMSPSDDICYAQGVVTNSSDGALTGIFRRYVPYACWASNPTGTKQLTIAALVVALCSQLLEAFVGFKYWRDAATRKTVLTPLASIFEALGVVAVASVLLSLPGLYDASDSTTSTLPAFIWLRWTMVTIVIVGAVAEITAECSDWASGLFPYLGAVGNGLVWLGAALLEVVVTVYLVLLGNSPRDYAEVAREVGGLFALELFGLVAMWVARGLWTRAKVLRSSVNCLEGPLRKGAIKTPLK